MGVSENIDYKVVKLEYSWKLGQHHDCWSLATGVAGSLSAMVLTASNQYICVNT